MTKKLPKLSGRAVTFLRWIRDNPHHIAGWLPAYAPPGSSTHFYLAGDNGRTRVKRETFDEAIPFFVSSPKKDRMYRLIPTGQRIVEADDARRRRADFRKEMRAAAAARSEETAA